MTTVFPFRRQRAGGGKMVNQKGIAKAICLSRYAVSPYCLVCILVRFLPPCRAPILHTRHNARTLAMAALHVLNPVRETDKSDDLASPTRIMATMSEKSVEENGQGCEHI
jgi:hypothetical protein